MQNRERVLLRATYDILVKCHNSGYVLNALEETAQYDGAECDGCCLLDDIAYLLDLPDSTELSHA